MYTGTMKPTFEYFCKGLINEHDRLIIGQMSNTKSIMEHNKKNPNRIFNKNSKPYNTRSTY